MARIEKVITLCDMPHASETSPAVAVGVSVPQQGQFSLDLCEACLRKFVSPMLVNARRVSGAGGRTRRRQG